MHPIPPLCPIHLAPLSPRAKAEPALQPSKQSLVTIPVVTPSLENPVLAEQTRKLKLSAIESKTQGNPPTVSPLFPQIILSLEAYTDPSKVFSLIESLAFVPIAYLRISPVVLSFLNIPFVQKCQALGLKLFLDLDLSFKDLQRLPSLAYTGASLLSYQGLGASALAIEEVLEAHHHYLPSASMVFKTSHFGSLESTIEFLKDSLPYYPTPVPFHPSFSPSPALFPAPHLYCQPEELAPLRQHFGPTLPLIVDGESGWVGGPLEIAKLPSLHMASCILLGRSILGAENPQLELEHIVSYLRSLSCI